MKLKRIISSSLFIRLCIVFFAMGAISTFFIAFIGPIAPLPPSTWQQDKVEVISRFKIFQASKPGLTREKVRFLFINETLKAMPKHDFDDIERLYDFIPLKDPEELAKK